MDEKWAGPAGVGFHQDGMGVGEEGSEDGEEDENGNPDDAGASAIIFEGVFEDHAAEGFAGAIFERRGGGWIGGRGDDGEGGGGHKSESTPGTAMAHSV